MFYVSNPLEDFFFCFVPMYYAFVLLLQNSVSSSSAMNTQIARAHTEQESTVSFVTVHQLHGKLCSGNITVPSEIMAQKSETFQTPPQVRFLLYLVH